MTIQALSRQPIRQEHENDQHSQNWKFIIAVSALEVIVFGVFHHFSKKTNDQKIKNMEHQLALVKKEQSDLKTLYGSLINANEELHQAAQTVNEDNHSINSSYFDTADDNLSKSSSGASKTKGNYQKPTLGKTLRRMENCLGKEKQKVSILIEKINAHRQMTEKLLKDKS